MPRPFSTVYPRDFFSRRVCLLLEMLCCVLFALLCTFGVTLSRDLPQPLPEQDLNVTQLIEYNGYPAEQYDVTTEDGYIINIQRIPHGKQGRFKEVTNKPVIFLQHGLLCSSTNWVTNLPNESFGYIAADQGFDVWLGNVRGNRYGCHHVNLSVNSDAFWAFSWDEMGRYDLPAMLNFVLKKTGQPSLYYAGHSQGTLMAFAELSHNPDLSKKIKSLFALGPVATVGYMKSPLKYLADFIPELQLLFRIFGVRDFLPSNEIMQWLASLVCEPEHLRDICAGVIFVIDGFDVNNLNMTRLPVYIAHTPAGTSTRNMVHFAQMYKSKKFQAYDYGSAEKNKEHYGQATAPLYNASTVNVPVALYWGGQDWLADPTDVSILMKQLPNQLYNVHIPKYQHLDFIWGLDAATLVYQDILKRIHEAETGNSQV